jgi:hypothetical protein
LHFGFKFRAKEHGRRHGNVPVIEVYIPFI